MSCPHYQGPRPYDCLLCELAALRKMKADIEATLDMAGRKAVRVCEGGEPEDLAASIAVTFSKHGLLQP